jgi:hypothetical protein
MAILGFVVVVLAIWGALSCLPRHTYRCPECGWTTPDRQDAAGHNGMHALHKIPL